MKNFIKVFLVMSLLVNVITISFTYDMIKYGNLPNGYDKMCKISQFIVDNFLTDGCWTDGELSE
jgi:hypothetical protein